MTDIRAEFYEKICLLRPMSDAGERWLVEHLDPDTKTPSGAFAVGDDESEALGLSAIADGLTVPGMLIMDADPDPDGKADPRLDPVPDYKGSRPGRRSSMTSQRGSTRPSRKPTEEELLQRLSSRAVEWLRQPPASLEELEAFGVDTRPTYVVGPAPKRKRPKKAGS